MGWSVGVRQAVTRRSPRAAALSRELEIHRGDAMLITVQKKKASTEALAFLFGAAEESRTLDLYLGKVSLYQLSYCRTTWRREPESNRPTRICNPVHNRFAIAPLSELVVLTKKGKRLLSLFIETGAAEESRTLDLYLGKVSLYQLSYCREQDEII